TGLAIAAVYLQGVETLYAVWPPKTPVDFFQEWSSATEVLAGRPAYPDLNEAAPRLLGTGLGDSPEAIQVNAHPPPAVLLGLPFALLSFPVATEVWRLLSLVLIFACAVVVFRQLGPLPSPLTPPPLVVLIVFLTSGPVALTIHQGQLNAVLLALVIGSWWAA